MTIFPKNSYEMSLAGIVVTNLGREVRHQRTGKAFTQLAAIFRHQKPFLWKLKICTASPAMKSAISRLGAILTWIWWLRPQAWRWWLTSRHRGTSHKGEVNEGLDHTLLPIQLTKNHCADLLICLCLDTILVYEEFSCAVISNSEDEAPASRRNKVRASKERSNRHRQSDSEALIRIHRAVFVHRLANIRPAALCCCPIFYTLITDIRDLPQRMCTDGFWQHLQNRHLCHTWHVLKVCKSQKLSSRQPKLQRGYQRLVAPTLIC